MSGGFSSPDDRLEYDFDTDALLEICIRESYVKVGPNEFRSWTGSRKINGEFYNGPTYQYLTNDKTRNSK